MAIRMLLLDVFEVFVSLANICCQFFCLLFVCFIVKIFLSFLVISGSLLKFKIGVLLIERLPVKMQSR